MQERFRGCRFAGDVTSLVLVRGRRASGRRAVPHDLQRNLLVAPNSLVEACPYLAEVHHVPSVLVRKHESLLHSGPLPLRGSAHL